MLLNIHANVVVNSFPGNKQVHRQQRQPPNLSPDSASCGEGVADKDSVSWFFPFFCVSVSLQVVIIYNDETNFLKSMGCYIYVVDFIFLLCM